MKKFGIWFSIITGIFGLVFFLWKFFKRPTGPGRNAYFHMGYLGEPVSAEIQQTAEYLAGRAKRKKEDDRNDLARNSGARMAGLEVAEVDARFVKKGANTYPRREYHGKGNY